MFPYLLNSKQFIFGIGLGLICSISLSLWKWNQALISRDKLSEEKMKKKRKNGEMKMVIVVRKDLKLTKRELFSQCVYACIGAFTESLAVNPSYVKKWQRCGQPKIVVKVNDESELLSIKNATDDQDLVNYLAKDPDSSKNNALILCIGPDTVEDINLVTGHLKLY